MSESPTAAIDSDVWRRMGVTGEGALSERMGIEVLEAAATRTVLRMPVAGNTQPYGLLHGGASCVLAETAASISAALHAGPDRAAVGIELNASHHRSATSGAVTAVATRVHGGRSVVTYEVRIHDTTNRPICTARVTCLIRDSSHSALPAPPTWT
ncbi:PaaI family thioesterase [Nocardia huaxiensis]|uniref:PaaI family thioesterase n=1 Tax=Nocardia huaxiensis TaxID=2755382 RepID=UPI001E51428D|nr:PaaI family thioesterase [Nocardia huaxiensis]UFS96836.1 PaaI family thioesterase [Nocardia huaxiensis]